MEVTGEITSTEVNIQIDVDDLASDVSDNIDWSDKISENIDVGSEVESLLDQYNGNTTPCDIGKSFEKAVWWAMSRQPDHDGNYTSLPGLGVREELKAIINAL